MWVSLSPFFLILFFFCLQTATHSTASSTQRIHAHSGTKAFCPPSSWESLSSGVLVMSLHFLHLFITPLSFPLHFFKIANKPYLLSASSPYQPVKKWSTICLLSAQTAWQYFTCTTLYVVKFLGAFFFTMYAYFSPLSLSAYSFIFVYIFICIYTSYFFLYIGRSQGILSIWLCCSQRGKPATS